MENQEKNQSLNEENADQTEIQAAEGEPAEQPKESKAEEPAQETPEEEAPEEPPEPSVEETPEETPAEESPQEEEQEEKPEPEKKQKPEKAAASKDKSRTLKKRLSALALCLVLVIGTALGYTGWQASRLAAEQEPVAEEVVELVEELQPTKEEQQQATKAARREKAQAAAANAAQRKDYKYFKWNPKWGSNEVVPGQYYFAGVNRQEGVVTIYVAGEGSKTYDTPVRAMICSGGEDTVISEPGTAFRTSHKYRWRALSGKVYGQYAVRISGPYLFHSVPYYTPNEADLEYPEYNKLGTPASMGCIRLSIVDVKWIYDNCALGMPVVIYDDIIPGPLGKPERFPIDEEDLLLRGWDPTDVHPANPYRSGNKWAEYENGTAIEANTEKIIYDFGMNDPLGPMWG